MRLGIVSDLHCNHAALAEALRLVGEVDRLICLGDSIFDYRFSNEVVQILKERETLTIQGNHEEGFFGPHGSRARAQPWIEAELSRWLAARPPRALLDIDGKRVLIVHSTPWEPRGAYVYPHSGLLARFAEADADIVLYGHTHHQLVRRIGRVLIVNPGSAGEARDSRNGRQLSCAVLDTASEDVTMIDFPDVRAG